MTENPPQIASSTPKPVAPPRHQDRYEQELSYIAEIAHALATAADEREILELIADRLVMLLGCEVAAILKLGPDANDLVLEAFRPAAAAARLGGRRFERAETTVDQALREMRPVPVRPGSTAALDPLLRELLGDSGPESGVVIPVRGPGGVELGGMIALNTRSPVLPTDIRFLLALADHVAVALRRTRAAQAISVDAVRLSVVSSVLHASSMGLEPDALLRHAMDALLADLPADVAEVALRDGGELRLRYVFPVSDNGRAGGGASRMPALHLRTVQRGEPAVVGPDEPLVAGDSPAPCMACFPLWGSDQVLGSLLVARRSPPYDGSEVELLAGIGRTLGIGVELASLLRRAAVEADALERVAAERTTALRATQEQLARSQWMASLGEIAAGVAHDLNNALNPIVAFAELIKEHGDQPDKARTYADRILLAAQSGAETVRRIQRFTRHRLGSTPFQSVSVGALVRDAIELVRPTIAERDDPIEVVEDARQQLMVNGNPGELRQALLNLITNALDAMPFGGTLRFVTRPDGDRVVVAVQDTGTGMASEIRERALEPFFTTKGAYGTGLGLAEAFGIARRHGGTLELETWPEVGTTMLLYLPKANTLPDKPNAERTVRTQPTRVHRVLLVDDNVLGLEATAASLRAAGHTVVTAADAASAIRHFRVGEYDVILSDLGLPDLSGWELVDRLHRQDPRVRIGVITGWEVKESKEELKRRGIEMVLTKPVDPEQLLSML